jgi:ABC-2 type transport system permease protein
VSTPAVATRAPLALAWRRGSSALSVVFASAWLQVRGDWHATNFILGVIQPASFLLITALAAEGTGRVDLDDAALGAGLVALWGATVWASGFVLASERWQGTLSQLLPRPVGLGVVLWGKTLGATLRSSILIGATVTVTAAVLGHRIRVEDPAQFFAALVAVLASALVLGLLVSCLFVLTRSAGRISEAIMYPVFILGGLLVPLSLLPEWAEMLSVVVSLRWGGELLRAAAAGDPQSGTAWLMLALTTAAYGALARLLFHRVLDRVRRDGTLELF